MNKKRELYFFKDYFEKFYDRQTKKVQKKILWTLKIIEEIDRIPEVYMKHLKNTSGLYEIRIQVGNNIYRVFCFFDIDNLVISKKEPENTKTRNRTSRTNKTRVL